MLTHNMDISPLQFFFIAVHAMFGANLLSLPSQIAEIAKEDMWMSMLLGSLLITASFWTAVQLSRYFPQYPSIEYHKVLLGSTGGTLLNIALLLVMLTNISISMRIFVIAIKTFLLDLTPPMIITIMLISLAWYACSSGLAPIIRLQQFLFLPSYGLFLLIIILGMFSIEARYYRPILAEGIKPVLLGTIPVWSAYTGIEVITGMLYPSISRKSGMFIAGMYAIGFNTIMYFLIVFIVQGILGAEETAHILIPPIVAYRFVEIPDTFIERLEGYLMTMWIFVALTCYVTWLYFIAFAISQMARLESSRPVMISILPLLVYLVALPNDHQSLMLFIKWSNIASLLWGLGILPLLLVLTWRKRRKGKLC